MAGKLNALEPNIKPLNSKSEYNKQLEKIKSTIIALNELQEVIEIKTHLNASGIDFNDDNSMYELNEYSLMQNIFKRYINFYLQTDIYLKLFLEKHPTFNTNEILIVSYDDLNIVESEELKEEKKKLKDDVKDHEKEFYNETNSLNLDDKTLEMVLIFEEVESEHLWKIKKIYFEL